MADPRFELLTQAYRLLAAATESPPPEFTVTIATPDGGTLLTFKSRPGEFHPDTQGLPQMQRMILAAYKGGEALSGQQLAARTGYAYSSRLRAELGKMVGAGLLSLTEEGYRIERVTGE